MPSPKRLLERIRGLCLSFPEASEVEVTDTRVVVTLPGRQLTYWHDAHDFVEEFDDGYGVKPRFVRLTDGYEEEAW